MEELRAKERRIAEFERSLEARASQSAVTVVSIDTKRHSILQPEHQLEVGAEEEIEQNMMSLFGSRQKANNGGIPLVQSLKISFHVLPLYSDHCSTLQRHKKRNFITSIAPD